MVKDILAEAFADQALAILLITNDLPAADVTSAAAFSISCPGIVGKLDMAIVPLRSAILADFAAFPKTIGHAQHSTLQTPDNIYLLTDVTDVRVQKRTGSKLLPSLGPTTVEDHRIR